VPSEPLSGTWWCLRTAAQTFLPACVAAAAAPQLRYKDAGQKIYWPASRVSPESAEMRADLGNATDFWQAQTFDGPGPETINSRLAMVSCASHKFAPTGQYPILLLSS
jgi:hypothetical protein